MKKNILKDRKKPESSVHTEHDKNQNDGHDGVIKSEHGHHTENKNRVVPILLVFLCTLLLAVFAGVGLALWDLGKTPHDMMDALTNKAPVQVMAAEADASELEEAAVSENSVEEAISENEVAEAESAPLVITDEIANIGSIVRAGDTDEMISGNNVVADGVSDNSVSENAVNPNEGYPLPYSTVDVSYFDDALFIGDSRMEGFGMRSGTNATFYAVKGFQLHKYETMNVAQTAAGRVPIFAALPPDAFTKIYIKVGLNELGASSDEKFIEKYAELITRLREQEPRAIIYIHGLMPVTAAKSQSDSVHSNDKILARNELLKQLAAAQQAYYIDVNSVVSDVDGYLKPEMTTDGIHLKSEYMDLWREYLRTHAVVLP